MILRVRNWDRYQYVLKDATKRRRIAFDIEAALLNDNFKGRGGYALLGAWIKVLAHAGRKDNRLPTTTKWWRQEFSRDGDKLRDRLLALDWLEEAEGEALPDTVASEQQAEYGAEYDAESYSGNPGSESPSNMPLCGDNESYSPPQVERDSTPDVEGEKPLLSTNVNVGSTDVTSTEDVDELAARRAEREAAARFSGMSTGDTLAEMLERRNA